MARTLRLLSLCVLFSVQVSMMSCGSDDESAPPPPFDIYVSDAAAPYQILKYDGNGENPVVFISENLAWPQDILFLEDQDVVLISNLSSGTITRHNASTGAFIDNFAIDIDGPTRMKVRDNLLYILQWAGSGRVLRYQLDGTFVDEFTSVGVERSIGMDWDKDGNLYVSSYSGGFVRKFDSDGNDLGKVITNALSGPTNLWFNEEGNILVNDWNSGLIAAFKPNGNFINNVITGLNKPEGVALLDNGQFLIGNGGTGSVKQYESDFTFVKDLVMMRLGGLNRPNAVVIRNTN